MKKILLSALLVALCAVPAQAATYWYWADVNGVELTAPIDAVPGETVRVWTVGRTNIGGWPPEYQVALEAWWDAAVFDSTGMAAVYDDPATGMVSDWCAGNYGAAPDYGFPDYAHYGAVVLQDVFYWYGGMRMVAIDFAIRADAPLGLTEVGGRAIAWNYYSGGTDLYETIEAGDPYALKINVVPEPATMSLLAIGGVAALIRRKK